MIASKSQVDGLRATNPALCFCYYTYLYILQLNGNLTNLIVRKQDFCVMNHQYGRTFSISPMLNI